jgi:hypothetical protein
MPHGNLDPNSNRGMELFSQGEIIKELAGQYKGPKNLKASGKTAGGKKKKEETGKTSRSR